MATSIASLFVTLGINSAQFQAGLASATASLRTASASMQSIGNKMAGIGAGLSVAITAPLVAFGVAASKAAIESAHALGQVEAALESTGRKAGFTAKQLGGMAESLMNSSLFDDDDIMKDVTAGMLRFGNISGDVFARAQQVAVDYSARTGKDLSAATTLVGKALNNPAKAAGALSKAGILVTDSQTAMIKSMIASGNAAGAQALILGLLESRYEGAAQAAQDAAPYDKLKDSFATLSEVVGAVINTHLIPLVDKLAGVATAFNDMSPAMQGAIIGAAAFAAALGPVVGTIGGILTGGSALIGWALKLGPALLTATGTTSLLSAAMVVLRGAVMFIMGPWGAALIALGLAVGLAFGMIQKASAAERKSIDDLKKSTDAYTEAAEAAASATDKDRKAKNEAAEAARKEAIRNREGTLAKLASAKASLILARAQAAGLANIPILNVIAGVRQKIMEDRVGALEGALDQQEKALKSGDSVRTGGLGAINLDSEDGGGKSNGGKSAADLAREAEQRRRTIEDNAAELELQEAQIKGDQDRVRLLERQASVRQRTRGLIDDEIIKDKDAAAAEAERIEVRLDAAREEARIKDEVIAQRDWTKSLYEIDGRKDLISKIERQEKLEERIAFWNGKNYDLVSATTMATKELEELDLARAEAAERINKANVLDFEIEKARLRGDTRGENRLSRQAKVDDLTDRYQNQELNPLSPTDARARAESEMQALDDAALQGKYRDFVKGGFQAAMDGDLAGFAQTWIKDWAGRGLEEALNSLGDVLMSLFKNIDWGKGPAGALGGGGGGINLGSIGKGIAGMFGKIPGFATGGSFKVGGAGAVDSKLVSMRLTPGEMVDVRRPGQLQAANNNSPMHFDLRGAVTTQDLLDQMNGMATQSGGNALRGARTAVPADRAKSDKYKLTR